MNSHSSPWVVVLAAGSGNRLSSLTVDAAGAAVPKQFCSLNGGSTLIEDTIARARRLTDRARIAAIVARQHRQWWQPLLDELYDGNVIEQPHNRGTAIGVMLTVLHLHRRDSQAPIVFLPSDHYIGDETAVSACLARVLRHLAAEPTALVMLGITPDEADPELGYIVPSRQVADQVYAVREFVEKPAKLEAERLLDDGAVWNSFIFAARAQSLIDIFENSHGKVLQRLRAALASDAWRTRDAGALAQVYEDLGELDFSRHVLAGNEAALRILPAPRCGWTDLGTPARVDKCVRTLAARSVLRRAQATVRETPRLNLANACSRLRLAV